jgi:short-subunit dehydrogenase
LTHHQTRFQDRVVLITGASAGIGAACARLFATEGAQVVLVARGQARLDAVVAEINAAGGRAEGVVADMGNDADCDRALAHLKDHYGGLDVLVNNAGLHHRGPFLENEADALAAMIDVNLRSPIRMTRLAMPLLQPRRGAVVNVASLAGCVPVPNSAVYSASKFGIRAFTLALAAELEGTGVTISAVSPGPVDTGFILDNLDEVTDITLSQPMVTAIDVAAQVLSCAHRGTPEIKMPRASGWLATIAYLFPWLKRVLQPLLERKGARAKARIRAGLEHTDGRP